MFKQRTWNSELAKNLGMYLHLDVGLSKDHGRTKGTLHSGRCWAKHFLVHFSDKEHFGLRGFVRNWVSLNHVSNHDYSLFLLFLFKRPFRGTPHFKHNHVKSLHVHDAGSSLAARFYCLFVSWRAIAAICLTASERGQHKGKSPVN